MKKAIFLNSGGPDALSALHLIKDKYEIHSLYIDAHLPNRIRAIPVAEKIAEECNCKTHKVWDIGECAIEEARYINPKWHKIEEINGKKTNHVINIPFQGIVFYSLGSVYAANLDTDIVIAGSKADIKSEVLGQLFNKWHEIMRMGNTINFILPAYHLEELQIKQLIGLYKNLKDYTVSCSHETACGICHKCKKKQKMKIKELDLDETIFRKI